VGQPGAVVVSAAEERRDLLVRLFHRVIEDCVTLDLAPHMVQVDEYHSVGVHFARSTIGEETARASVDALGEFYGVPVEDDEYSPPTLYTRRGKVDDDLTVVIYCGVTPPATEEEESDG